MNRIAIAVLAVVSLSTLVACGGGGDGPVSSIPWPIEDEARAVRLTGGQPLNLTEQQLADRSADTARANTWVVGDALVFSSAGHALRLASSCYGSRCTLRYNGYSETVSLDEPSDPLHPSTQISTVMVRNGVALAQARAHQNDLDMTLYGGWLRHSAFYTAVGRGEDEDLDVELLIPASGGWSTRSNPALGSAVWNGVMIGTTFHGNSLTTVQGDAAVGVDFAGYDVDVAFTNIVDLQTGAQRSPIYWDNLTMRGGAFQGAGIDGRFYGPNHEEVGGVFERNQISGAFGATKQ